MRKNTHHESGFFNPRLFGAFLLCAAGAWMAMLSFAGTPSSGTLSNVNTVLTYDAGPFNVPNQTPAGLGQLDSGPRCNANTFPCDSYALTLSLPAGYAAAHPSASIKVTMSWTDTGAGQSDYDLYIYKGVVGNLSGSQQADYQAASGANPEIANISPLVDGTSQFTLKIVPFMPTQEIVHVKIELLPGTGGGGFPGFGGPDPTAPGAPRYQTYSAPVGSSAEASNGEINIGFNPATGRIMLMNSGPIWRVTPPERFSPAKPECCDPLWEDKSNPTTNVGLDPIIWADQVLTNPRSARIFASNSTAGTNGVYGFSDDDGDTWLPLSAAPPNASSDHETIGSGPYPAALSALGNAVNHGHAVYYCAQTFPVGAAACQRSDTYGSSYGPPVLPYNGNTDVCGGIHGHVHVGPDGTVYLPVRDCSGNAGVAVSTDGGITWTENVVPNSATQTHGSDPTVAIGANNTVYFFYVASNPDHTEGHMHVQVSTNHGQNWSKDTDLGISHGVINSAFPEAVAGDDNRAACAFLGTDRAGDYEGGSFAGVWYAFISTTYDGGNTWTTVNATPNDPVQGMIGIWQGGGSNANRNLLDFNEITMDDKGRVLSAYDDGCVGDCIADPSTANASYGARMRVARQSGGKGLLQAFDVAEPTAPKPSCLSGTRDTSASHLTWKVPDNGGADIVGYQILRGTTAGGETVLVANTGITKNSFNDTTADPAVAHYFYVVKAINSQGIGLASNEIDLVVTALPPAESLCLAPGLTKLADSAGDNASALGLVPVAPAGSDLLSFQIAQPYQGDGVPRLVFTINTDPGMSPQPAASSWFVAMKIVNGATTTYKGVHMTWNGANPTFESYTPAAGNSGATDGRFVTAGSQKAAEPGSSYGAPFNKIVIIVKASDLGLAPGSVIAGFNAGVTQTAGVATDTYDEMPSGLSYTNTYTVVSNSTCNALQSVVSRKTHGVGAFDISLPFAGNAGIECRSGGAGGNHTLVYTLDRNVTVPGTATVAVAPSGSGTASAGPNANQVTVNLSAIPNAQHVTVTLNGVVDAASITLSGLAARLDVLPGDTNADGVVNSSDVSQTKAVSGQLVGQGNFRNDVTHEGTLNSADVSLVKSKSGTALP